MIPIILEKQKNIRDLGDTVTLDGRSIKRIWGGPLPWTGAL